MQGVSPGIKVLGWGVALKKMYLDDGRPCPVKIISERISVSSFPHGIWQGFRNTGNVVIYKTVVDLTTTGIFRMAEVCHTITWSLGYAL